MNKRIISLFTIFSIVISMITAVIAEETNNITINAAIGKTAVGYNKNNQQTDAAKAVDGFALGEYVSIYNAKYIEIDLGCDYPVNKVTTHLRYGDGQTYTVMGKSENAAEYKSIGTFSYATSSAIVSYDIETAGPETCRYIRLCTEADTKQMVVCEIEVYAAVSRNDSYVSVVNSTDTKIEYSDSYNNMDITYAIDKNKNTNVYFHPNSDTNDVIIDLGKAYEIGRFDILCNIISWESSRCWAVSGSADKENYTLLTSFVTKSGENKTFDLSLYFEKGVYRYIRLRTNEAFKSGHWFRVSEIDVLGNPVPDGYEEVRENIAIWKKFTRENGTDIANSSYLTDGKIEGRIDDYSSSCVYYTDFQKEYYMDEFKVMLNRNTSAGSFVLYGKKDGVWNNISKLDYEVKSSDSEISLIFDKALYKELKLVYTPDSNADTKHLVAYEFEVYGYNIYEKDYEEANIAANGRTVAYTDTNDSAFSSSAALFDEDENTSLYSSGYGVKSTTIDLGMKYDISSVYYKFHGSQNISNREYTVSVSADGSTYTDVGTVRPDSANADSQKGTLLFGSEYNARYVRFSSAAGGQVGWYEIKVFGKYKKTIGLGGYIAPDNGDSDISTLNYGSRIGAIHFGYDMNAETLNNQNITITSAGGTNVNLTGKYTVSDNTFTFELDALESFTEYTVSISENVQKANGETFANKFSYSFTTGVIIPTENGKIIKNAALNKGVSGSSDISNPGFLNDGNINNYTYVKRGANQYITIDLGGWYDVRTVRLYERNIYPEDDKDIYVKASGLSDDVSKMDTLAGPIAINKSLNVSGENVVINIPDSGKKYRYISIYRENGTELCIAEAEVFVSVDADFDEVVFKQAQTVVSDELNWLDNYTASINYAAAEAGEGYTMIVTSYNSFGAMNYYEEFAAGVNAGTGEISCEFTVPKDSACVKAVFGRYLSDGAFEILAKGAEAPASDKGMSLQQYVKNVMDEKETEYKNSVLSNAIKSNELKISFLGGSITQGAKNTGWTAKTVENIENAIHSAGYSDVNVVECNAGIGGTGSAYGTIRLENDVISQEPDIVVVEFAVNDNNAVSENTVLRNMEGIVRQLKNCAKQPMLMYVYTSSSTFSSRAAVHQRVADYYNIGAVNIGDYLMKQAKYSGEDISKYFVDNVHPSSDGQQLYADVIWNSINKNPNAFFKPIADRESMTENPSDRNGSRALYNQLVYNGSWTEAGGSKISNTAGDSAEFTFTGREILVIAPTGSDYDGDMRVVIKNSSGDTVVSDGVLNTSKRNTVGSNAATLECYINYDLPEDTYSVTFINDNGGRTGITTVWYA